MKTASKIFIPTGIVAIGVLIAALLILNRRQIQPEPVEFLPPLVRVMEVRKQDYQFTVRTQGNVALRTEISLAPEVSGRVVAVSSGFRSGGFFEEGEVLIEIDPRDYELAVIRARAALAEARVRVAREEAEAEIARGEWDALGSAGEPNALMLREPQLAEARAAVDSARAALEQAERDLERTRLVAPFAGRVLEKSADIGGFVATGSPVARIHAIDVAEVRLPISLDQLAYLDVPLDFRGELLGRERPQVRLRASVGGRSHTWQGRIVRAESEVDPRTRMIHLIAEVENPYGDYGPGDRPALAAGLFVEAEIHGKQARDVAVVPRAALRNGHVLAVDSENRLRHREVELLRMERDQAVLGEGLREGDRVCISTMDVIVEGMRVRVAGEAD
jgi:membrane fusion protein, multidrug efflux system